jgi:hypothetical protein
MAPLGQKAERESLPMQDLAKKEYGFSWQQQRALIRCSHALSEEEVRVTVELARTHGLPVSAMGLVVSKNGLRPCITREGTLMKLHTDPRGLDGIETEVLQWADEANGCVARVKCTVKVNGKPFVDYAQHSKSIEDSPNVSPEAITMKCIDQAITRAVRLAAGSTMPSYEEEERQEQRLMAKG